MPTDLITVPASRRAAIELLAPELVPGRRVAISTHLNADGDGCGSESALARLLSAHGLAPRIVNPTPWPDMFAFLLGDDIDDQTSRGSKALRDIDLLIVLDISDVKRLGNLTESVRALTVPKLVIDHHLPSDDPAGTRTVSDTTACATAELVYDLAIVMGWEIGPAVARSLYTGMLTDTGGFRFSNTSPRCLSVAGQLLAYGVDPEDMYTRIYASAPAGRVRLMAEVLGTLQVDEPHGLSWLTMSADALEKHNVKAEDLDGIVEHARSIAGTKMALFFRDLGHGKVKVSFRSVGGTDVNAFARRFGGGGHAKASGALLPGTLDQVRDLVVEAARVMLAGEVPLPVGGSE
ncbi:MAG TPA: bifunctional oligoribonuclease/PAP phosphatase NrnA [Gemmatimonadaceae bacterium]|nr:bifunctional oligoribonuclease/PAP phosphatase NrnA [Gemmatimonadaceae bacterium]